MIPREVLSNLLNGRRRMKVSRSTTFIVIVLMTSLLSSRIQVTFSCVVSPSEIVATVGERVSFTCNARPTGETRGDISDFKQEIDSTSAKLIFQPPRYSKLGIISSPEFVADGYFLSYLNDDQTKFTIEINETQLKHGGKYFCICAGSGSTFATADLAVLDHKLSFVLKEWKVLTSETSVDLHCSVSFNGSTPSVFIDLTILNATGERVSNRRNLPLIKNVTSYHVNYSVIGDPNEVQHFTCEMKVWNKSSTGTSQLFLRTSKLNVDYDIVYKGTGNSAPQTRTSVSMIGYVVGAVAAVAAVIGIIALLLFLNHRNSNRCGAHTSRMIRLLSCSSGAVVEPAKKRDPNENSCPPKRIDKSSIEHPSQPKTKNSENNDVVVFENDFYGETPKIDPSDGFKKEEQVYSEIKK